MRKREGRGFESHVMCGNVRRTSENLGNDFYVTIALRGIYESSALLPVQYLFVYGKLELFFLFFFLHSLTTIIKDTIISITILHRLEQKLLLLCTHAYLFGCGCFRCILGLVLRLGLGISFHRKTKFPHRA